MDEELIVTTSFPFKKCIRCTGLALESSGLYADGALAVVIVSCSNKDICQNAYDVWKGEESE